MYAAKNLFLSAFLQREIHNDRLHKSFSLCTAANCIFAQRCGVFNVSQELSGNSILTP